MEHREKEREAAWEQYAGTLPSDTTVNYHRIRQGFDAGYEAGSAPYEAALRVMQYKQRHGLAITNSTGSLKRWLDELKRVAVRYFEFAPTTTFDEVAWKVYYDDGLIPWDALVTDMAEAK